MTALPTTQSQDAEAAQISKLEKESEGETCIDLELFPSHYFHLLPLELRRLIIETTAIYFPEKAQILLATCTEFRAWVEPIRLRHITFSSVAVARRFVASNRQRTNGGLRFNTLCITYTIPTELAYEILQVCRGVQYLAFWSAAFDTHLMHAQKIIKTVLSLPLTSLSIYVKAFLPGTDPDFSFLPNLKYLNISDPSHYWTCWSWSSLSSLTNLTHLSLNNFYSAEPFPSLKRCLAECNTDLEVCVLRVFDSEYKKRKRDLPGGLGRKFVMLAYPEPVMTWKKHVRGEEDDWAEAELIISRRSADWAE